MQHWSWAVLREPQSSGVVAAVLQSWVEAAAPQSWEVL